METPFLQKLGQKIVIFRGFSKSFSELPGFQLNCLILIEFPNILHCKTAKKVKLGVVLGQNLGQIMSNVAKKVYKETGSIIRFFFIFYLTITFKAKSSGCKTT